MGLRKGDRGTCRIVDFIKGEIRCNRAGKREEGISHIQVDYPKLGERRITVSHRAGGVHKGRLIKRGGASEKGER